MTGARGAAGGHLFGYVGNIACDISGITTKAPCEAALMGERHVRIEISDFVMRTFVLKPVTEYQLREAVSRLLQKTTRGNEQREEDE
mgnify:CR=1 FL=1